MRFLILALALVCSGCINPKITVCSTANSCVIHAQTTANMAPVKITP